MARGVLGAGRSHEIILDTVLLPFLMYGVVLILPVLLCLIPLCCWWMRSCWSSFKMRDCWCFKSFMRASGVDKFDDFEVMLLVHEIQMTHNRGRPVVRVRVTAGSRVVETDPKNNGIFQQSFLMLVEQGTRDVCLEVLDQSNRKLAVLKLDPLKDILPVKGGVQEKFYAMQAKGRGIVNPRILLTMRLEGPEDEEKGLLANVVVHNRPQTAEQQFALREHLLKVGWNEGLAVGEQLDPLARACAGPVECISGWGSKTPGYLAVKRPPERRRFTLGLWRDQKDCEAALQGTFEVDLMRVANIEVDPGRSEVFVITYLDPNRFRTKLMLRRVDRATDVWVETLSLLIALVRGLKQRKGTADMIRESSVSSGKEAARKSKGGAAMNAALSAGAPKA